MTFKNTWEKTNLDFQLPIQTLQEMVKKAVPDKTLASYETILGGCANLNIKLHLVNEVHPLILRVYVRDKDAAYREQKLASLIKSSVPLPEIYFIGEYDGYRYSIAEYREGISLRDLLLNHSNEPIGDIMFQTGQILATIQRYQFPRAGFFDAELNISQPISRQDYIIFARECLLHPIVLEKLSSATVNKLTKVFETYGSLFPDDTQKHLVHGDYGPENILVDRREGQWKVTAILDWEFAHSGSPLSDVANMLRYAHKMPPVFEETFLQGLAQGGVSLPKDWCLTICLLNLLSLLDIMIRYPERHNQCTDICELVNFYLEKLLSYHTDS